MENNHPGESAKPLFLRVSLLHLILMSIITCKLYEIYWFFQNWRIIKERDGVAIKPFGRALLGLFFVHRLFERIHNDQEAIAIQKPSFSHAKCATSWIILVIIQIIVSRFPGLSALIITALMPTFLCFIPVQRYVNTVEKERNPSGFKPSWTTGQIILIAFGIIFWTFTISAIVSHLPRNLSKFEKIGGVSLVLEVDVANLNDGERKEAIEQTINIVKKRIDGLGTIKAEVKRNGDNEVRVLLFGVHDETTVDAVKNLLVISPLSFHVVIDDRELYQDAVENGLREFQMFKTIPGEPGEPILIQKKSVMDGRTIKTTYFTRDQMGQPAVGVTFDEKGTKLFAAITANNINRRLAVLLNGQVLSAPKILEPVTEGQVLLSGHFSSKEAKALAEALKAGALPAAIEIVMEEDVSVQHKNRR